MKVKRKLKACMCLLFIREFLLSYESRFCFSQSCSSRTTSDLTFLCVSSGDTLPEYGSRNGTGYSHRYSIDVYTTGMDTFVLSGARFDVRVTLRFILREVALLTACILLWIFDKNI